MSQPKQGNYFKLPNEIFNMDLSADEIALYIFTLEHIMPQKWAQNWYDVPVYDMDENEEADLQTYLGMMQKYIEDNTERHHTDLITGYTKNTDYDRNDEDDDSGVKAPKKNQKNNGAVKAPSKKR